MTLDHDDLINSIMASLDRLEFIKAEDIPNIELYMDQVTTFMERRLKNTTRNPGEDKVLTKTMINNYAKNDVLPPPIKKKYSKEHMYILIVIYYFKNVLSINDINTVIDPIKEHYFGDDSKHYSLDEIYEGIRTTAEKITDDIKDNLLDTYKTAVEIFPEAEGDEKALLTMFSFITLLVLDIYIKKLLVEKLVDGYNESIKAANKKKDKDSGNT